MGGPPVGKAPYKGGVEPNKAPAPLCSPRLAQSIPSVGTDEKTAGAIMKGQMTGGKKTKTTMPTA